MGWKCKGCGATNQDGLVECEYCGRHHSPEEGRPKNVNSSGVESQKLTVNVDTAIVEEVKTALDPARNYKSVENSIKPNFDAPEAQNKGFTIFLVIIIFIIVIGVINHK